MRTRVLAYLLALAAVIVAVVVATPTAAHADDMGFRWGSTGIICVRLSGGSKPTYLVDYAVKRWNVHPDIRIVRRSDCSTYSMRVIIREGKYGTTASAAWTRYEGPSFPTPCASRCNETGYAAAYYWGADSTGVYDWLTKSKVVIRINTSKRWTYASYEAMVVHELGHALGLSHTDRCDSVMSETCFGRKVPTAYDNAELERIYPW